MKNKYFSKEVSWVTSILNYSDSKLLKSEHIQPFCYWTRVFKPPLYCYIWLLIFILLNFVSFFLCWGDGAFVSLYKMNEWFYDQSISVRIWMPTIWLLKTFEFRIFKVWISNERSLCFVLCTRPSIWLMAFIWPVFEWHSNTGYYAQPLIGNNFWIPKHLSIQIPSEVTLVPDYLGLPGLVSLIVLASKLRY